MHAISGEEHAEEWIGRLLRIGVSAAAAVVFGGALWYLGRHGGEVADYRRFVPTSAKDLTEAAVVRGLMAGQSRNLIRLGLLLLIATPIARVALSLYLFAKVRDYTYCLVTSVVLAVLLSSLYII